MAIAQKITNVKVTGNAKVESEAIITILETKKDTNLDKAIVKADIKSLYGLGYFSSIVFLKEAKGDGVEITVEVIEKPAIVSIGFQGMEEVSVEDVKEKMQTKIYTIINESVITADQRMIEQMYAEKGYYLAQVTYELKETNKNEVDLIFVVNEHGKVLVGNVEILGNEYFTDSELMDLMATRDHTRSAAIGDASLYQDEKVKRDLEFLSFWYRDYGFAEVKVAKPITYIDPDRKFVRVTFQVEEGIQYSVNKIEVSGDILFPQEELLEAMKLKPGALFKHSWFGQDIEMLTNKYGDLGYAYADVNPKTTFNQEAKTVDINYVVTKGEKVYFGEILVVGNTKTRDNVIRREMEVNDSELYSGTNLTKSKRNIDRLGYFEESQILRERDEHATNVLNLKVRVKEGHTGQLQAALGYTPAQETKAAWFGQGKYDEKNQSGRGWGTSIEGKWSGEENYEIASEFSNPRVNNSRWSLGLRGSFQKRETESVGLKFKETRQSFAISVGRRIIENLTGTVTYVRSKTLQTSDTFILEPFRTDGIRSSLIFRTTYSTLNNYLDPSEGLNASISHQLTGLGLLGGDYEFMETAFNLDYYFPIDFTDTYRTYFKFHKTISTLWPVGDKILPYTERYKLGGFSNLRGYDYATISPTFRVLATPGGTPIIYPKGGDKQMYMQLEYFIPLIPEAKIKGLLFTDWGRVYDENESISYSGFSKDVGFGLRWITPIAPFRFEWAYPILEDGSLGDLNVIFNIGY